MMQINCRCIDTESCKEMHIFKESLSGTKKKTHSSEHADVQSHEFLII